MSVPEQWLRDDRARQTPAVIVAMLAAVLTIGVFGTAVVLGLIAWTRRQFAVRAFLALLGAFAVAALIARSIIGRPAWPPSTAQPFQLQVLLSIANGCLPLLIPAAATALAAGAVTRSMSVHWSPPNRRDRWRLSSPVDAGVSTATDMIRGTQGPTWPDVSRTRAAICRCWQPRPRAFRTSWSKQSRSSCCWPVSITLRAAGPLAGCCSPPLLVGAGLLLTGAPQRG